MVDKYNILEILNKYNFWNKKVENLWYVRKTYLDKIESSIWTNDLIKVLIWQRRVWKSYILKQFINSLIQEKKINPKNILYINLEYEDFSFIKTKDDLNTVLNLYIKENKINSKFFIFIDEIQEIAGWEKFINSIRADHTIEVEIYITWSNSSLLSSELSTYLSWRYITFNIFPFSFEEYLNFKNLTKNKQNFIDYINFSWIPEVYNLPNKELQRNFISSLKDTIILKDLVKRYSIKEVDLLEKIFYFLSSNIWNLFSINAISRKLKSEWINISPTTLSNYLRYLQNILVFYWVDRYDLKWKRILEWEKKYYLNDLWFINFLFSSFDDYAWKKLENYIFNYLNSNWYTVYTGNLWNLEIDFVAEKNNEKIYIQASYLLSSKEVIDREYWNLKLIKDSFPKYVISMDDILFPVDDHGIKHLQVWDIDEINF
ncbi:MAG: hypothetical protein ACD_49C00060G0044 [uncultured bacterium (gcode 4)]|uniref:Uncharacterized protein n=1 Tax=uncultured bacterium (gcode 4) TaxID=1234023 RepID=K2AWQ1_9BACT|nr:MAG: hypothetical protein ACD_49C00060G0044 [uncultured bacterium (gcode 4)]